MSEEAQQSKYWPSLVVVAEKTIHRAVLDGDLAAVELLISNRADLNAVDIHGCDPLHYAVRDGFGEIVGLLLQNNVDVQKTCIGSTPLMLAIDKHPKFIGPLLEAKASPNTPDRFGNFPLHYAAQKGDAVAVSLLLRKGADVNAKSPDGTTALHEAASAGHVGAVRALLIGGADRHATIPRKTSVRQTVDQGLPGSAVLPGLTPYEMAAKHKEVAELFRHRPVRLTLFSALHSRLGRQSPLGRHSPIKDFHVLDVVLRCAGQSFFQSLPKKKTKKRKVESDAVGHENEQGKKPDVGPKSRR